MTKHNGLTRAAAAFLASPAPAPTSGVMSAASRFLASAEPSAPSVERVLAAVIVALTESLDAQARHQRSDDDGESADQISEAWCREFGAWRRQARAESRRWLAAHQRAAVARRRRDARRLLEMRHDRELQAVASQMHRRLELLDLGDTEGRVLAMRDRQDRAAYLASRHASERRTLRREYRRGGAR